MNDLSCQPTTGLWRTCIVGLLLAAGNVFAQTQPTTSSCENNPTHAFTIPAWAFDRGNPKTFTKEWADAGPMVAFGGKSPVFVPLHEPG